MSNQLKRWHWWWQQGDTSVQERLIILVFQFIVARRQYLEALLWTLLFCEGWERIPCCVKDRGQKWKFLILLTFTFSEWKKVFLRTTIFFKGRYSCHSLKILFFALGKVSFCRLSISAEDKSEKTALRHSFSAEGENEVLFSECLRGEGRVCSFKCAPVA